MIPKLNIDQKIEEQKIDLLNRLTMETKLPVTDIKKDSFDKETYVGSFLFKITGNLNQAIKFKYENQNFYWNIETITTDLESIWAKFFANNKSAIEQNIQDNLHIDIENTDRITCGKQNIIYVYEKNATAPITVVYEYENGGWLLRRQ